VAFRNTLPTFWIGSKWMLEIVKRSDNINGFQVLSRRWVVERTFGWLGRYRRFNKDYEDSIESGQAFRYISMIHIMLKRLGRIKTSR
jgi:putative transposase